MIASLLAIWSNRLLSLLQAFAWLAPLAIRISVGWVFVESGWGKWHHLDKVIGFFTDLGLPSPVFQAYLVSTTELAGGLCLLAGLFTRLASIPLGIIMVVAIVTTKGGELHGFSDLIGISEYLYLLLLFSLFLQGAGGLSVDAWLKRLLKRRG